MDEYQTSQDMRLYRLIQWYALPKRYPGGWIRLDYCENVSAFWAPNQTLTQTVIWNVGQHAS